MCVHHLTVQDGSVQHQPRSVIFVMKIVIHLSGPFGRFSFGQGTIEEGAQACHLLDF